MIDRTQMCVAAMDHKATITFYEEALEPVGYEKLLVFDPTKKPVVLGTAGCLIIKYTPTGGSSLPRLSR